jgi:predicted nucleic acid-binding protein
VQVVVADTGPLQYLVLIDAIEVLPRLFATVLLPAMVQVELHHPRTPAPVHTWLASHPAWLEPRVTPPETSLPLPQLGKGERAAIALAQTVRADLLLMDDRAGVVAARALGVRVMGTLGVLDLAARHRWLDFDAALTRLKATNFRCRPEILDRLLAQHQQGQ